MKKSKSLRRTVCCGLIMGGLVLGPVVISPASYAASDWFGSLINNIQTNSPAAWEGQKRGYFTGGGISIRNKASNNSLFNIQAPRVQAGCGGIDVFWGGFSYLNPEYMIKMFQHVMTAAPAYAFKLALEQLCAPCGKILAELKNLADAVNNMGLDECGMAFSMVNAGGDFLASSIGMKKTTGENDGTTWASDFLSEATSSVNKFVSDGKKLQAWAFCGGFQYHGQGDQFNKCMAFTDINGSIWDAAKRASERADRVLGEDFLEIARAYFGEMIVIPPEPQDGGDGSDGKSMYKVEFLPLCDDAGPQELVRKMLGAGFVTAQNVTTNVPSSGNPQGGTSKALSQTQQSGEVDKHNLQTETIQKRNVRRGAGDLATGDGGCQPIPMPAGLKIADRAQAAIDAIAAAIQNNPETSLNAETISVIMYSKLPIYQIINTWAYRGYFGGVISGEEAKALTTLTTIGYAEYVIEEFVNKAEGALDRAYAQLVKNKSAYAVDNKDIDVGYSAIKKNMAYFRASTANAFKESYEKFQQLFRQNHEFVTMREQFISLMKDRSQRSVF